MSFSTAHKITKSFMEYSALSARNLWKVKSSQHWAIPTMKPALYATGAGEDVEACFGKGEA